MLVAILMTIGLLSDPADSLDARLQETQNFIEQLETEEAAVSEILDAIRDHLGTARNLYNELALEEAQISRQLSGVADRYNAEDYLQNELEKSLSSYLLYMYSHRNAGGLGSFFVEGGFGRMLRRQAYVDYLASRAAVEVYTLGRSRDSLNTCRDSLEILLTSIQALREQMGEVQTNILAEEERQIELRAMLSDDIAAAQESIAVFEAASQSRALFVTRLSSTSSSTSQGTPLIEPSEDSFIGLAAGSLPWPAAGQVARGFGVEIHPIYHTETNSDGLTLLTAPAEPVYAIAPGDVLYAREFLSMGMMVVVDHLDGYHTIYGYMDQVSVMMGDQVEQGDQVGRTGLVPGGQPGYYFEIRRGAVPVNPREYLE